MSTPSPALSRRVLLRGAGVALGVAAAAPTLVACAGGDESDVATPDPLAAEAMRARSDAASATAAIAFFPQSADALTVVGAERTAHADALEAEIARLTPPPRTSGTTAPTTSPPTTAAPPASLAEFGTDLTESSRRAAELARSLSGYRAGLLGSVSAACVLAAEAVSA